MKDLQFLDLELFWENKQEDGTIVLCNPHMTFRPKSENLAEQVTMLEEAGFQKTGERNWVYHDDIHTDNIIRDTIFEQFDRVCKDTDRTVKLTNAIADTVRSVFFKLRKENEEC